MSYFVRQKDVIRNMSPSRVLAKEMKELRDLADKSLARRILDYEAYGPKIQQIFQRVKEATMVFFVRSFMSSFKVLYIHSNWSFQFEMAVSIQQTASEIRDDIKVSI